MAGRKRGTSGGLRWLSAAFAVPFAVGALLVAPSLAAAEETQFGTLSNFDTFNTSEEETHGFEIELDGVSASDVTYTFGAPYQARYGTPRIEEFPGGVYVRWESPYDAEKHEFTQGTPPAPKPVTPTMGHQCWVGASAEYFSTGCEHFGLGLLKEPTKVVYHWLVANPAVPGGLMESNTKVPVPPVETKINPVNHNVQVAAPAPEPPEVGEQWGEAEWVKMYVTESPLHANLDNLLTDNPEVPEEPEQVETEWFLLQSGPKGEQSGREELKNERPLGKGDSSVTRRYEFFQYTGKYNPEDHEAEPAKNENEPQEGEVGEYLGAQMAAANFEDELLPLPVVNKLSAKKGPAAGGTAVTISGANLREAIAVRFGAHEASEVKVVGKTLQVVAPAGTTGTVDVTVITAHGASVPVAGDKFTYGSPTVTSLVPSSGPTVGGAPVAVKGSGFAEGENNTTFLFGKSASSSVVCASTTSCTVLVPSAAKAGKAVVKAQVGKKKSKSSAASTYVYQ